MMYSTRKEAKLSGSLRYFTGKVCRNGHVAERQTVNGTCFECAKSTAKKVKGWIKHDAKRRGTEHRRNQKRLAENTRRQREDVKAYRRAERMRRIAYQRKRTPAWSDLNKIKDIYKEAHKLGPDFHVDHVVPLNGKIVSGLHVPENLQIIPARENLLKGHSWI